MSGRAPKGLLLGIGAAAVALVVLVGGLYVVQSLAFSPKSAVSAYFSALGARDAAGAWRASGNEGTPPPTMRSGALRKGSGYEPPTDVSIGAVTVRDHSASARVSFRLAGRTRRVSVAVQRDDRKSWLLFHGWHVSQGSGSLMVVAPGLSTVTVDGVSVSGSSDGYGSGVTVPVFPGSHRVGVGPNPLLAAPARTVAVDAGSSEDAGDAPTVQLAVSVKESAHDAVDRAVRTLLDRCAQATTLDPDGCPFSYYSYYDADHVQWTITKYPTFEIAQDEGGVSTSTTESGTADVTYTYKGYDGKPAKDHQTVDIQVDGTVTVKHGQIAWQPSGY
ncbi:hypothetical protein [Actinocatenispora rupis]|uniref:Uncharacterized protein n=1 Tax=Actinocatenispora rupis TaxID=519421 RepID=A0A8J3JCR4_9ACTN|nr:hypothetical protein [Actinocatenispora rupis]GID15931.1 hypothetical protein Aru02nite_68200 [Actinocatenispora rupis]